MAKQASRQVSVFLNGSQVEGSVKNISAAFAEANNRLKTMVIGSDDYISQLEKVRGFKATLDEHNRQLKGIGDGYSLLKTKAAGIVGIAAGAFAVDSIIGYGKALLGTGIALDTLERKAKTVFGEALPAVTAEAKRNAEAMGLTTTEYVNAAAAIQDLLVPMGFQRKEAADISTQLVNLSGALSEWTGGQIKSAEVSKILSNALLGEREELKQLGIAISQADVDAQVAAKGMDKLTGKAKEQAEAMATLELVLQKSGDAQAAFANNSESAVRRQAELNAKFQEIYERLATLLLPILERLVGIAGTVVGAFGAVVDVMEGIISPAEAATNAFDRQVEVVSELESNVLPLADRYDELTSKATLNAEEQTELNTIITTLAATVPTAVTEFDKYGNAIGINTDKVREFIATEKERLKFINAEAIKTIEKEIAASDALAKRLQTELNLKQKIVGINRATDAPITAPLSADDIRNLTGELQQLQEKTRGANAELQRLRGDTLKVPEASPTLSKTNTPGKTAATKKSVAEEVTDAAKGLAEFEKIRARVREVVANDLLEERFARLIAQREALEDYTQHLSEKKLIDINYEEEKQAAIEEINLALLSDEEAELLALQNHYAALLRLAEQYGIDTLALREAQKQKEAEVETKFQEQELQKQQEAQTARLQAMQATFTAFGDFVTATFDLLGGEGEKAAAFQKVATLAKIAFDTAAAISSLVAASNANPANAVTFGAAGIAQYVAGFARIISNIAQAKKILTSAPEVKQKYMGGFLDVIGASDGRPYRAMGIDTPNTGLLPGQPVLFRSNATGTPVLASERGAEYFVAAHDLRNPYVAGLVRMIDLATHGRRVPQFAEGGVNAPATAPDTSAMSALLPAIQNMNALLQSLLAKGVVAVLPDSTIVAANKRFNDINNVSGGFFS